MIRTSFILIAALGVGCDQSTTSSQPGSNAAQVAPDAQTRTRESDWDSPISLDQGTANEDTSAANDIFDAGINPIDAAALVSDVGVFNDAAVEPMPDSTLMAEPNGVPGELTAILEDIPGFGADTIGGRDGTLYTVTGLHDDGPGSLRFALESPEPLWIVFAAGLNGVIQMTGHIDVASFKTIDARGHDITLRATENWRGGLRIGVANGQGVEHVVILNLSFDGQWPNYTEDDEGDDGINIRNGSHHIWIHQCSFTNWIDGAIDGKIDAGFPLPHHVTISKSFFTRTHQPLAVAIDYLTFARNHCLDVTKRCIQLNDGGRGHMVNNVIEDWRAGSIVASRDGAQLLVDNNMFKPGGDSDVVGARLREDTDEYGDWQNENNHWRLTWGWVSFQRFTQVDREFFDSARESYSTTICGIFDLACWDTLYGGVVDEAGTQR